MLSLSLLCSQGACAAKRLYVAQGPLGWSVADPEFEEEETFRVITATIF